MKYYPTYLNLVVKPIVEKKKASAILTVSEPEAGLKKCLVLEAGPGKYSEGGPFIENQIKKGAVVYTFSIKEFQLNGETVYVTNSDNVLLVE